MAFSADDSERKRGVVYTGAAMARVLCELSGYGADLDPLRCRVLEPACGDGALLREVARHAAAAVARAGAEPRDLIGRVFAVDIDPEAVATSREVVAGELTRGGIPFMWADQVARDWVSLGDALLDPQPRVDLVLTNPPYVRSERIPERQRDAYRARYPGFRGRADLYFAFLHLAADRVRPGGRIAALCPDKWLHSGSGAALRRVLACRAPLRRVVRVEGHRAFSMEVSAYPTVMVASPGPAGPVRRSRVVLAEDGGAAWEEAGEAPALGQDGSPWRKDGEASPSGGILSGSTHVGGGMVLGCDRAFLVGPGSGIEPDRLLPYVDYDCLDLGAGVFSAPTKWFVNPYDDSGRPIDLDRYPRARAHLEAFRGLLEGRSASRKGSCWYRTIDVTDSRLCPKRKLILPRMCPEVGLSPVIDPGGCILSNKLYYVTSDLWDLEVLGGYLMSEQVSGFLRGCTARFRGGYLDMSAYHLRRIPVPDPRLLDLEERYRLRVAFRTRDRAAASRAVAGAAVSAATSPVQGNLFS